MPSPGGDTKYCPTSGANMVLCWSVQGPMVTTPAARRQDLKVVPLVGDDNCHTSAADILFLKLLSMVMPHRRATIKATIPM